MVGWSAGFLGLPLYTASDASPSLWDAAAHMKWGPGAVFSCLVNPLWKGSGRHIPRGVSLVSSQVGRTNHHMWLLDTLWAVQPHL